MVELGFPTRVVREGGALLVVPVPEGQQLRGPAARALVFYNPGASLSRDLSLLALKAYASRLGRPVSVADPLTGCGARAIRYAQEGPENVHVAANDLSREAIALARKAAALNNVEARLSFYCRDARVLLLQHAASGRLFDFIDLDPFGSPAPFLHASASALRRGGVLTFSATDSATLSGVYPRTCIARYWAKPLKTEYHHEVAARILIGFAARTLAAQGLSTRTLAAHQLGYALRVYLKATVCSAGSGEAASGIGYLYHCFHCLKREMQAGILPGGNQNCGSCGRRMTVAGPLWTGPLFDVDFSARMLEGAAHATLARPREAYALLAASLAEASAPPTYYTLSKLGAKARSPLRPIGQIAAGLRRRGYRFVETHFEPGAFRTDAPAEAILEVLRPG